MTEKMLTGCSVLVVEDEFFLAEYARDMLEDAGARVLGPVGNASEALQLLDQECPDCALVDVNLGQGPCFDLAYALQSQGVPFLFTTGYDAGILPEDLAATPCLQKPLEPRAVVRTVAATCR